MKAFGITNIGSVRAENQDSFAIRMIDGNVLAVVCDGMGGAAAGKLAAKTASEVFLEQASASLDANRTAVESLNNAVSHANRVVYRESMSDPELEGMGTTLVALYLTPDGASLINVGDSSAFRFSKGKLKKLTHDHSLVQEMLDNGMITAEQARTHPKKNIITRVVGGDRIIRSDMFESEAAQGDVFILCSDGLTNAITEEEALQFIDPRKEPQIIAEDLIQNALNNKARDNVTVVIVTVGEEAV